MRWLRRGGLGLAGVSGPVDALAADLVQRFGAAGLPARVYPDAGAMKWSKLVANLVGNASGAVLGRSPPRSTAILASSSSSGASCARRQP